MTIIEKIKLKISGLKSERQELSFLYKQLLKNEYHNELLRVTRDMDWIGKQIVYLEELIEEEIIEELIEPTKKAITKEKKDIRLNEYETIALMKYYDYVEGKINRSEINKYDNQFKTVLESFATIKEDLALVDKINVYFKT